MIKSFFKILGFVAIIYSIFSLPVGKNNLFGFLTENLNPAVKKAFEALTDNTMTSLDKTKQLGSKLFSNSNPPSSNNPGYSKKENGASEEITEQERAQLNNLIEGK